VGGCANSTWVAEGAGIGILRIREQALVDARRHEWHDEGVFKLSTLGSTERMDLMDLLVERLLQRKLRSTVRQRTRQPSARLPTADSANATKQKLVAAQ
jgi:hypothetical protein